MDTNWVKVDFEEIMHGNFQFSSLTGVSKVVDVNILRSFRSKVLKIPF